MKLILEPHRKSIRNINIFGEEEIFIEVEIWVYFWQFCSFAFGSKIVFAEVVILVENILFVDVY